MAFTAATRATVAFSDANGLEVSNTWFIGFRSAGIGAGTFDTNWYRGGAGIMSVGRGTGAPRGDLLAHHGHYTGALHAGETMVLGAHVVTIASNGTGVENAEILTGARSLYLVDCLDADGCTLHVGNVGLTVGQAVQIISISANATILVPSVTAGANRQHIAGAAFSMGVNDALTLRHVANRSGDQFLLETSRSNN